MTDIADNSGRCLTARATRASHQDPAGLGHPAGIANAVGLPIIESDQMVVGPFEDWSKVRSHGRAARRRKRGFRQNIRLFYKPRPDFLQLPNGTLVGHPEMGRELKRSLS